MSRPLRVFLCHASQDKPAVWRLHRYLKQHGVQPWLDQEDLLPGQDWRVEIPKAIDSSDVIVVCLSKNSVNKEGYVQAEITFALDKALEKPEGTIFIVPIKLEGCDIPNRLGRYQWVDLSRADGRKRLLLGLSKRASDLGSVVLPVVLEDVRQRKTAPKPAASDVAESEKAEQKAKETAEREATEKAAREKAEREAAEKLELEAAEKAKREKAEQKATELAAQLKAEREAKEREKRQTRQRKQREFVGRISNLISSNSRLLGIGGITLLVFIFGGFGLKYFVNNLPVATAAIPSPTNTATLKPPTLTSIPFTSTPRPTKTLIPTPTLGVGSTEISPKDGMTLLYVPAGEFTMGIEDGWAYNEKPVNKVSLDAFWIDQTEVTNAMYTRCLQAGSCKLPRDVLNHIGNPKYANHPVTSVSLEDANSYCLWVGRRLPTEAEWEKAARGPNGNIYPWGNSTPNKDLLNYKSNIGDTTEVGKYPNGESYYGAYDMAGNVWEWVSSLYKPYPYIASDGREDLSSLESRVVIRGGSWYPYDDNYTVRSTTRSDWDSTSTGITLGFRCARSQ